MFISNITRDFYEFLSGKRLLVLVHYDIDAICACKILQSIFKADHLLYTLCPVLTQADLLDAVRSHIEQVEVIVLVNCGGTIDLVEFLQLPQNIIIYVADTHRPLHVCNIYSDSQVRVVSLLEDDEEVPAFTDVFRDDESSDSEEDEDGVSRITESKLEKRRERRLWEQKRNKLLFDYSQFSYYAGSSATLMFELAWKLSKDDNDLLWLAIIGLCSESIVCTREPHRHALAAASLNGHVARLHHNTVTDPSDTATDTITFDKDVQLSLYRHWSLVESLKHTPYSASALKLWTHKGEKRMLELLAELGLPLTQCRQLFCGMDINLRSELPTLIEGKAEKYGLEKLVVPSFSRSHILNARYSASDFAHAALATLEPATQEHSRAQAFLKTSDCLNGSTILSNAIGTAKQQLEAIYSQVQTFLDMNQVISAGPFLYATVLQGAPTARFFCGSHVLGLLGRFTLQAHVSVSRNKKARSLPLVLTTPHIPSGEDWCLVCGIPPTADHSYKNFFGKAFEQAIEKTQSRAERDFFDTHVIKLRVEDRSKFFDALISLLS